MFLSPTIQPELLKQTTLCSRQSIVMVSRHVCDLLFVDGVQCTEIIYTMKQQTGSRTKQNHTMEIFLPAFNYSRKQYWFQIE
jgi:hypothetical protein